MAKSVEELSHGSNDLPADASFVLLLGPFDDADTIEASEYPFATSLMYALYKITKLVVAGLETAQSGPTNLDAAGIARKTLVEGWGNVRRSLCWFLRPRLEWRGKLRCCYEPGRSTGRHSWRLLHHRS